MNEGDAPLLSAGDANTAPLLSAELLSFDAAQGAGLYAVTLATEAPRTTAEVPGFAQALLSALPSLKLHRCDNDAHASLQVELGSTEPAHAFEHVVLEMLAMRRSARTGLEGATGWSKASARVGEYRVRVLGFQDETEAREVGVEAARLITQLLNEQPFSRV